MYRSLIVKPGLLLIVLTIDLIGFSPVQANITQTTPQNQKQLKPQQIQEPAQSSQQLWEQFRQQQDVVRLQQQQRIEQFRIENQIRQQPFTKPNTSQLREQQRREMDEFRLQQNYRQPQ
ncbi:MAG: hypothetical protein V7K47_03845 [Nostoc sp.]